MSDIRSDEMMLTIFLRHDQSQTLDQFQAKLDTRNWWDNFPPDGVEIVSWYVVMGIGQIATLRLPPSRIQAVNVALEKYAWDVFRTEAYPTYDFAVVRERLARESRERRGAADSGSGSGGITGPADAEAVNSGAGGGSHPCRITGCISNSGSPGTACRHRRRRRSATRSKMRSAGAFTSLRTSSQS